MNFSYHALFILLILLVSGNSNGASEPKVHYWQHNQSIKPELWYIEDKHKTLNLDQAQALFRQGQFQPIKPSFNFGYSKSSFWLLFDIKIPAAYSDSAIQDIVIEFNYPHLDHVEVYKIEDQARPEKIAELGDIKPFHERILESNLFIIPDQIKAEHHYRYWVRIDSTSSNQLHPSIWKKNQYIEHISNIQIAYGFYFGIIIVMGLYNLFIGLSTKDQSYFYYVGYILSFATLQACLWGYAFQYLWPDSPNLNDYAIPGMILLSLIFSFAFTRSFLQTRQYSPLFHKLLGLLIIIGCSLIFVCFFIEYQQRITLSVWLSLVGSTSLLATAIKVSIHGQRFALLFLLAWTTLLIGAVVYGFAALGYLPSNIYTRHAAQIGSAFEVILLSLALADRINQIKAEKRLIEKQSKEALESKNQELEKALHLLTKSNALKDEFLATISHELRTPMNGIEGSLQIVKQSLGDSESNKHLDAAFHSAHHMTQLVESLLEYSELQSGNWKLNERPFDFAKVIENSTRSIQGEYVLQDVSFEVKDNTQIKHLLISDPERIEHLIFQLLDNAFKFTQKGSVAIEFSSAEKESHYDLFIKVTDSGIGISPAKLKDIFEGFRQADGSFSRQYGGLGIGLSICKAITDRLEGCITVDSTPNKGTSFHVLISLKKGAEKPACKPQNQRLSGAPHILVVEDNPVNQMTLVAMIKKLGCQVTTANNGEEAVKLATENTFNCILMDCQMPVMDGFEATRLIRKLHNSNAEIPIIAVTANAMSSDRDNCIKAGMNDYVKKPVKPDAISERLSHWLNNKVA